MSLKLHSFLRVVKRGQCIVMQICFSVQPSSLAVSHEYHYPAHKKKHHHPQEGEKPSQIASLNTWHLNVLELPTGAGKQDNKDIRLRFKELGREFSITTERYWTELGIWQRLYIWELQ